jgi:hypothetical protein
MSKILTKITAFDYSLPSLLQAINLPAESDELRSIVSFQASTGNKDISYLSSIKDLEMT